MGVHMYRACTEHMYRACTENRRAVRKLCVAAWARVHRREGTHACAHRRALGEAAVREVGGGGADLRRDRLEEDLRRVHVCVCIYGSAARST